MKPSQEDLLADSKGFAPGIGEDNEEVGEEINKLVNKQYDGVFTGMERKIITIYNQEGPSGDKPVFVAVNGRGFSIPREQEVSVPICVIQNLENAVEVKYYRDLDDQGREVGPIKSRKVRRYNFSVR